MSAPPGEPAPGVVDLRTGSEVGEHDGRQPFSTLADRLALGTATVGVVGLDRIGVALLVAAGVEGRRVLAVDPDPGATLETIPVPAQPGARGAC